MSTEQRELNHKQLMTELHGSMWHSESCVIESICQKQYDLIVASVCFMSPTKLPDVSFSNFDNLKIYSNVEPDNKTVIYFRKEKRIVVVSYLPFDTHAMIKLGQCKNEEQQEINKIKTDLDFQFKLTHLDFLENSNETKLGKIVHDYLDHGLSDPNFSINLH